MRYFPLWTFPLGMVLLNVVTVVSSAVFEGRLRPTSLQYAFLYASTIPAAARGDLEPFTVVLRS
jgi:hypothetical protein